MFRGSGIRTPRTIAEQHSDPSRFGPPEPENYDTVQGRPTWTQTRGVYNEQGQNPSFGVGNARQSTPFAVRKP